MIDYAEHTGCIRIYENGNNFANRDPYVGHVHVTWLSKKTIQLDCAIGKITRESLLDMFSLFFEKGVEHIMICRNKSRKMPFSGIIKENSVDNIWDTDLTALKQKGLI